MEVHLVWCEVHSITVYSEQIKIEYLIQNYFPKIIPLYIVCAVPKRSKLRRFTLGKICGTTKNDEENKPSSSPNDPRFPESVRESNRCWIVKRKK